MGNVTVLNVDGKKIKSIDLKYSNLVWLYNDFKRNNGRIPRSYEGLAKNNLPQFRITKKLLEENNITYNDFCLQFGVVSNVRTENKEDYNSYVEKFKKVCDKLERTLGSTELTENTYGLPGVNWLIKYCPSEDVKTYDDFVRWCGLKSNKRKLDKEYVANRLIQLEKDLGRPIKRSDIKTDKVGFSSIVINRIWGGLNKAKMELGLEITKSDPSKPFEFYRDKLLKTLHQIELDKGRKIIAWSDIENPKYNDTPTNHKTYIKAFKKQNLNFYAYIKSLGYTMCQNSMGNVFVFDDGELTESIYEYDFSTFIRDEMNMEFNQDYKRGVMYKSFSDINTKINCDYVISIKDTLLYVEIAGVIYNNISDNWRTVQYNTKRENNYRENMLLKEDLLLKHNKSFLFLFPWDMLSGKYKDKLIEAVKEL